MGKYTSTKAFKGFPCSHRRHAHDGHCAFIHGYSRAFKFWFECTERTEETGFVMDFGDLKDVKAWLTEKFDHTLLIDSSDPLMPTFKYLQVMKACKLTVYDDVGMEGTARYVHNAVSQMVYNKTNGRVRLVRVECSENEKNSAIYEDFSGVFGNPDA